MTQAETQIDDIAEHIGEKPADAPEHVTSSGRSEKTPSVRSLVLYVGLAVLLVQLTFVSAFFPSYGAASELLEARQNMPTTSSHEPVMATESKYADPDLLQWSGAQSLTWIASLFAPETPVRFAPALIFFLVVGGFLSALYRPGQPGSIPFTVLSSGRSGMRVWSSWFAGALVLVVYILTSSGGMEAMRVSASITFERPWKDISDAFLSHWLIYIAWFALLGFLPMLGGTILGLLRTRFLTQAVTPQRDDRQQGSCNASRD